MTLDNGCIHNLELACAANEQKIGSLGHHNFATGHINGGLGRAYLQHVTAVVLTNGQLLHGFANNGRIISHLVIGKIKLLVKPMALLAALGFTVLAHMFFVQINQKA